MAYFLDCAMHVVAYTYYTKNWKGKDAQPSTYEQLTSCREFAGRNDYFIVREYTEEIYSYQGRPLYYQMLGERINTRFSGILVYSSDIISKSSIGFTFHKADLKEWGISLFTTNNNK